MSTSFVPQSYYSDEPITARQEYFRKKYKLPDFVFRKRLFRNYLLPDESKMMEIKLQIEESKKQNHEQMKKVLKALDRKLKMDTEQVITTQTERFEGEMNDLSDSKLFSELEKRLTWVRNARDQR